MWLPDLPATSDQGPAIMIVADGASESVASEKKVRTFGVCEIVDENDGEETKVEIFPGGNAADYLVHYESAEAFFDDDWTTRIANTPRHGVLQIEDTGYSYNYLPNEGYVGDESFVIEAERQGVKVTIHYFIHVLDFRGKTPYNDNCGAQGSRWKISALQESVRSSFGVDAKDVTLLKGVRPLFRQSPKAEPIYARNSLVTDSLMTYPGSVGEVHKIPERIVHEIEDGNFCTSTENPSLVKDRAPLFGGLTPAYQVLSELVYQHGIPVRGAVSTRVTTQPANGFVQKIGVNDTTFKGLVIDEFSYMPNPGFLGEDHVVFKVLVNGQELTINYVVRVVDIMEYGDACQDSLETDEPAMRRQSLDVQLANIDRTDTLTSLGVMIPGLHRVFEDLPGTAIGRPEGGGTPAVVLDADAAGHGWFIDATPQDNSEFLPTADTNIFIAKVGSAAEGKMDMLSVLLHEYGHALGLGHSADPRDAMAAVLKPGVRHLLSVNDLALLYGLTLDLPTDSANGAT